MFTLKELQDKVEKGISEYIGFDVNKIFEQSDYITIYGGAVRDSLAGVEIHDIDILCMPNSAHKLKTYLNSVGYESLDLYDPDTLNMYHGISLISEPWTLMNDKKKIIQIIRPRWNGQLYRKGKISEYHAAEVTNYQLAYYNLIKNVDISCCGVFLENHDREIRLREACKNSIINCLSQTYTVNKWAKLYSSNRTENRKHKLSTRGWIELDQAISISSPYTPAHKIFLKKERLFKIMNLEFNPEYNYKIWTEEEYLNRIKPFEPIDIWDLLK